MAIAYIEGSVPLVGSVRLAGAKNSAVKLMAAAMFSNEDIILENVPHVERVECMAEQIRSMGAKCDWLGPHRMVLNGSSLNTSHIMVVAKLDYRVAALLLAPLIYRFGKASIEHAEEKKQEKKNASLVLSRWMTAWNLLGYKVTESPEFLSIELGDAKGSEVNFKVSTLSGTENAILSSLSIPGKTVINNAAEEVEMDDLIDFANQIGGSVERVEPRRIVVEGKNVFKGARFEVQTDKKEAVVYAVASLITNGNIIIQEVDKSHLTSFVSVLTKLGAKYEFSNDELRVWSTGEGFMPLDVVTAPAPGFLSDWQPLITLLLTQANGVSKVHETIYTGRLNYTKDLNRMGAKIDVMTPSQAGIPVKISDDSYDISRMGEPFTVAKITGPTKLRGTKVNLEDSFTASAIVLATLNAEGRSEVGEYEKADALYEDMTQKLISLGARINFQDNK